MTLHKKGNLTCSQGHRFTVRLMNSLHIQGGQKLNGDVMISGAKNAALPILYATILTGDSCTIDNIPYVSDILKSLDILEIMGAKITMHTRNSVTIDTTNVLPCTSPQELASEIRGSTYLIGAEIGRFKKTCVARPGGCVIGGRPIDLHIKAMEALGAELTTENGYVVGNVPGRLVGTTINFDKVSVGATINAILAAAMAEGTTIIENAAREPHIVDLAVFLNKCGASISGAGTSTIRVRGTTHLHGCRHTVIPDMIEAGTYMAATAVTGGKVTLRNVIPKHMEAVSIKLREMGVTVLEGDDTLTVIASGHLRATKLESAPYPGFPTDMQPQFGALLCYARGAGIIKETIFENRFRYVDELRKMGAEIEVANNIALVSGSAHMTGAHIESPDLRAGAALVIAALAAKGDSVITNVDETIERGYYNIVGKLQALGAHIEKVEHTEKKETRSDELYHRRLG